MGLASGFSQLFIKASLPNDLFLKASRKAIIAFYMNSMSKRKIERHIATIGYEKSGFGDFVQCLKSDGIERVLDIRDLPLSRRAGFSKRQLAAGLEEFGIAYSHLKGLGTPKEGRIAVRAGKMDEFHEIFAAHMQTDVAKVELENAVNLVTKEQCCLLCYEAEPERCHRYVVATALTKRTKLPLHHLEIIAY